MRGLDRVLVFCALAAACGGSNKADLFGTAPSAEPNTAAPTTDGSGDEDAGGTTDPDGGKPKVDGGARTDGSVSPDGATPAPPTNPLDGIGDLMAVGVGYGSLEGPVWRAGPKSLLFSDLMMNSIERFAPPSTFATFRTPSGGSNGLALDAQGRLIVCERNNRRVTRTLSNGTTEIIADSYQDAQLNAPNDAIVRSDGTVFFTDPDYSIYGSKELSFNGVYRVTPAGVISLVADDLEKPNGIALSPDEKTLYVTDEHAGFIRAYDVAADGSTANARRFAEAANPDGIAVDDDGNVYAATKDAVLVLKPDGQTWGKVDVPKQPANVAFGGTNRKTLFVTAGDTLYQVDMVIPGPP